MIDFFRRLFDASAALSWRAVLPLVKRIPSAMALPGSARINAQLAREIEDRRRAEEEVRRLNQDLQQRVEELQTLLDVLPVGIGIALDRECLHIRTNRALAQMLALPEGANASKSAPGNDAPSHFEVFHEGAPVAAPDLPLRLAARQAKVVPHYECDLRFRDGRTLHMVAWAAPLFDHQGAVRGAVGAFLDVTDRKRAEAERQEAERRFLQAQKLESMGILAGGIAHDFNNLLTGVLGNASLVRQELPTESRVLPCVERIETAAQRAADLCQQMLAYSGRGKFVVQQVDLSQLVAETVHLLQASVNKKTEIKLELAPRLPVVAVDATQIGQVVMNLVMNASEALEDRSGTVTLRTGLLRIDHGFRDDILLSRELPEGDYVFLEVSDTGCGMNRETLTKIFDPFFTTKFTGRGLGLAAVLGIVRGHKGALKVTSEPGRGSVFKIMLPAVRGSVEAPPRGAATGLAWQGQGRVLIIDDEAAVRNFVCTTVKRLGLQSVQASDGQSGLALFRAHPDRFDLVLLDLTMPALDGRQVFREIHQLRPAAKVILMSGYDAQVAGEELLKEGLTAFLQKPFRLESLREAIRSALDPTRAPAAQAT